MSTRWPSFTRHPASLDVTASIPAKSSREYGDELTAVELSASATAAANHAVSVGSAVVSLARAAVFPWRDPARRMSADMAATIASRVCTWQAKKGAPSNE